MIRAQVQTDKLAVERVIELWKEANRTIIDKFWVSFAAYKTEQKTALLKTNWNYFTNAFKHFYKTVYSFKKIITLQVR